MNKQEIIEALKKKGYNAQLESNVPMITLSGTQTPHEIRSIMRELGYQASFGYKEADTENIPEPEKLVELTTDKNGQYLLF